MRSSCLRQLLQSRLSPGHWLMVGQGWPWHAKNQSPNTPNVYVSPTYSQCPLKLLKRRSGLPGSRPQGGTGDSASCHPRWRVHGSDNPPLLSPSAGLERLSTHSIQTRQPRCIHIRCAACTIVETSSSPEEPLIAAAATASLSMNQTTSLFMM